MVSVVTSYVEISITVKTLVLVATTVDTSSMVSTEVDSRTRVASDVVVTMYVEIKVCVCANTFIVDSTTVDVARTGEEVDDAVTTWVVAEICNKLLQKLSASWLVGNRERMGPTAWQLEIDDVVVGKAEDIVE